jgi:hypothetical protein
MALQSQLLRDLERGLQWIASALRERAIRMDFRLLSSSPRQDVWRWLVAGDAVKTECEERVAQRCGEPARPGSNPEARAWAGHVFLRLHHEIPGMRIGLENGFGKSGKQRIEDSV